MKKFKRIICMMVAGALLCGALSFAAPQQTDSLVSQAQVQGIALHPDGAKAYSMKINDRVQLYAQSAEAGTISWQSAQPQTVSVTQSGIVTALTRTASPVKITGWCENGDVLTCDITVLGYTVTGITLTPQTNHMQIGQTQTISAQIQPAEAAGAALTWSSGNEAVLQVTQSGAVTAVSEGTADIFARAENGCTAKCTITVSGLQLTGIVIEPSAVQLKIGETAKLTAKPQPEGATLGTVHWTSDAPEVASVAQDGTITAKVAGTATIQASDNGGKTASCTVTVAAEQVITQITLDKDTLKLNVGSTAVLKATISPAELQNTPITWQSSNAAVARVENNGTVTALKSGTAVITTSAGDVSAQCTIFVSGKQEPDEQQPEQPEQPDEQQPEQPTEQQPQQPDEQPEQPSGSTGSTIGSWNPPLFPSLIFPGTTIWQYSMPDSIPETVFLTIDSDLTANSTNIESMLNALEISSIRATFFVPVENLYASGDLLRHIAGNGHSIGLLLTAAQAQANAVELLNNANEALSVITGTPTRLVRIAGGSAGNLSAASAQTIRENGYRLWDWSTAPSSYDGAVDAIDNTGIVTVYFDSSANAMSIVQQLAPYMQYCNIPARGISAGDTPVCQMP